MSFFIYNTEILDRENESDEIATFINLQEAENQIIWVCADTGIGKTALIRKAIQKQKTPKIFVEVVTPPVNHNDCPRQGEYLSYITQAVNDSLKNYGDDLKSFIYNGIDTRIGRAELNKVLSASLTEMPKTIVTTILSRYVQTGLHDVEQYLLNLDTESILLQREYLKYCFTSHDIILYVSNMQNIDSRSLNELKTLIETTEDNCYLFEFTTKANEMNLVYKDADLLGTHAKIAILTLDTLPINYAVSIVGESAIQDYSKWESYYKTVICGNLYKLQNVKNESKLSFEQDPLEAIYDLPKEGLVILQIVSVHDGELSLFKFSYILSKCEVKYKLFFENKFDLLSLYLQKTNDHLRLKHSSVKDFILNSQDISVDQSRFVTYSMLRNIFNIDLVSGNFKWYSKQELVLYLIKLYFTVKDTNKILELLDQFKELIAEEIDVEQINILFEQLFKETSDFHDKYITLQIVKTCYDFGLYTKAYKFLEEDYEENINFYMYKAILLNRLDKHTECINYCIDVEKKNNSNRYQLTIQMIKMLSLRTLNMKKEYRQLYNDLLNNKVYKNCLEYGFLLRNSEILYSPVNDIPYIERSIKHFKNFQNPKNEVYSKITLATEYAYAGKISQAKELLKKSKDLFFSTTTEKHIYYNDIAAIDLEGRRKSESALLNLEHGLLSSQNSYDTLTLLSNKICWYIVNEMCIPDIETFKRQISSYTAIEPDLRIKKRIYFNFYQYYKWIESDELLANYYWTEMLSMSNVLDDKLNKLINKGKKNCRHPQIYVSFITYWHFDIPNL